MIYHCLAAAIASCGLLSFCKVAEFCGSQTPRVSPKRRLPYDSDAILFGALLTLGTLLGGTIALICMSRGVQDTGAYWPLSALVGAVAGFLAPLPLVRYLARGYLERAHQNLVEGQFRDAIEDAAEAERMYFDASHKQAASAVKEQAQEARSQEIGIAG